MAKSPNQKLKILYLMELFLKKSDAAHVLSIREMVDYLAEKGIRAERKSLYDDIEVLRTFGLAIENRRERPAGYYLANRLFCAEDCSLLFNIVQSNEYITKRKERELTRKIAAICPETEERYWDSELTLPNRVRFMEDSPYGVLDLMRKAMDGNHRVTFRQAHLTKGGEVVMHRYGSTIWFSPWKLVYEHGNYCVEGMEDGERKSYLLDEISYVTIVEEEREALIEVKA